MNIVAPVVALDQASVSLEALLRRLHQRGRLQPLLREGVIEQFLLDYASEAGLTVASSELQFAADSFRRRNGLKSAEQTNAWLAERRLSINDLEDCLERDLLIEKLKDHLTRDAIASHFREHSSNYDRARVRIIEVAREDLARELLIQLRDEGRDFSELAREHSRHASRVHGGIVAPVMRRQLPEAIAKIVFDAQAGQIVGPLAMTTGSQLLLVEEFLPAELNRELTSTIRANHFQAWLTEQLSSRKLDLPLLEVLACSQSPP